MLCRNSFNLLTCKCCDLSLPLTRRKLFSDENGKLLQTGDLVKFEKLADTLEVIAKHGADAFYNGSIGEDLIRDIQEAGIVRQILLTMLSFQPFSISAWHYDLITKDQIDWICGALQ